MTAYPANLPEHHVYLSAEQILEAALHVCALLAMDTSWRGGHCALCGTADDGRPQGSPHEADCVVLMARLVLVAEDGE